MCARARGSSSGYLQGESLRTVRCGRFEAVHGDNGNYECKPGRGGPDLLVVHFAAMRVMSSCCSEGLKLWICSTTDVRVQLADIALFCRKASTSRCSPNSSPKAS